MFKVKVWQFIQNEYVTCFTGPETEASEWRKNWFAERERSYGHTVDISRCIMEEVK